MSESSVFDSRTATLSCTAEEFYTFMADFRNIEQFVPDGTISDLQIENESVSFHISPLGNVKIWLTGKEPVRRIICSGIALNSTSFKLFFNIDENAKGNAAVRVTLAAEMNPVFRMIAAGPVEKFLGILIDEMEKFNGWGKPCQ